MAEKDWALINLGTAGSLRLVIDGDTYDVATYTASWALNEIPRAQCLLAVGRSADTLAAATVNRTAAKLQQMQKAQIYFDPVGEYRPDGTPWPRNFLVFDGYFVGLAYQKINGKISVIVNLIHWLVDLACSSTLSMNSHPSNHADLTAAAAGIAFSEFGVALPAYVSKITGNTVMSASLTTDLWGGIKQLFCFLAGLPALNGPGPEHGGLLCGGNAATRTDNTRALAALKRLEGRLTTTPSNCDLAYQYGVPLPLQLDGEVGLTQRIADSILTEHADATIESYATTTFWDKLVGVFCPRFQMAVAPQVDRALVIADVPGFNAGSWKTLPPSEYDAFQMQAELARPLRTVAVLSDPVFDTMLPESSKNLPPTQGGEQPVQLKLAPAVFGCYSVTLTDPNDGIVLYVPAPPWLRDIPLGLLFPLATTGVAANAPTKTDTTPAARGLAGAVRGAGKLVADALNQRTTTQMQFSINKILQRYAKSVFVSEMLRGRGGTLSGKLRFDIAPGSTVVIKGSEEKFLAGEDALATDLIGCVQRVTTLINAEGGQAGTTLVLSHLRTAAENQSPRTSQDEHPLFGKAIHGGGRAGAPLVAGHERL